MNLNRVPADRIREAILHSDEGVRTEALSYFTDALSEDPEVLPTACPTRPCIFRTTCCR